jgi:predicted HTH domain antitoxin
VEVTICVTDEIAAQYHARGEDLARRVLEDFAVHEYAAGRLTLAQLRQLLGLRTRYEAHGVLKQHGVPFYTDDDFEKDLATLDRMRG